MEMPLAPDFREFLSLLNSAGIEYLLVGGFAVAAHGHPRATGDLDLWVPTTKQTASSLLQVLETFGFGDAGATTALLMEPNRVIRMGVPPVRIELLTGVSGVSFEGCWRRRMVLDLGGLEVPVISRADLIQNKRCAGRAKDAADLEALGEAD